MGSSELEIYTVEDKFIKIHEFTRIVFRKVTSTNIERTEAYLRLHGNLKKLFDYLHLFLIIFTQSEFVRI